MSATCATASAALFWAAAALATWGNLGHAALAFEVGAAVTMSLVAYVAWQKRSLRDRAMLYLIDRAAASRRSAQEEAAPLRAVRAR